MEIANLQAFVTIANAGSFSLAAERLYLTQPAISKRIAQLESELGVRLFDRIGRRIALTEAGETLLGKARTILLEVEDTRRAIGNLAETVSGHLSVGTSHHIALHRLSPVLKQFNRDYAEVELDLRFHDSETICELVEKGELEMGIATLPDIEIPNIRTLPVWTDQLVIVYGDTHPLAQDKHVTVETLMEYPVILPGIRTYTRSIIEKSLLRDGLAFNVRLNTNNLETIRVLVEAGMGWSVLPRTMSDGQLIILELGGITMTRDLGLVLHEQRTLSNAAKAMMEIIQSGA